MPKYNKSDSFFLILGDQLFPLERTPLKKGDDVLMVEDYSLCSHYKYHKKKILFFLIAMRDYRDALVKKEIKVEYRDGKHKLFKNSFSSKIEDYLQANPNMTSLHTYEISDHFFKKEVENLCKKLELQLHFHPNPMFVTSQAEFKSYLQECKKPMMANFYLKQRKRLRILVDKQGNAMGGRWSFDTENRKKYPKGVSFSGLLKIEKSKHFKDVEKLVQKHFTKHPGLTDHFWLPTNRKDSKAWLQHFIDQKFEKFGPYEDAIHSDDTFGFHSALSPMLNNGLILVDELVEELINQGQKKGVPLASIEGYIRQVIGWREFTKGIYDNYSEKMNNENFWRHQRKLKSNWYEGETGVLPLDDSIRKAQKYGYTHHIERLMILSNMMLLCEVHPHQVHRWFMEMYVDSADWVMAANVYGMGQMSEGGIFSTKPYICGSNYILKMSNYNKADWCEIVDGLYWRFIDKNKKFFASNPRMSMMVKMSEKLDSNRKKTIFKRAETFIEKVTH